MSIKKVISLRNILKVFSHFYIIYLRNKETQQTFRNIVSIQFDASFFVQMIFIDGSSMCPTNDSRFNVSIDYVIILICA